MSLIVVLALIYAALIFWLTAGLLKGKNVSGSGYRPKVSVIIAARNEELNLEQCLISLSNQDYPENLYDVYIIDDRSEDETRKIASRFADQQPNFNLIVVDEVPLNVSPKKNAIQKGIDASDGEIIMTTDADCSPPEGWISGIVSHYNDEKIGMVVGYAPLYKKNKGPKESLLKLDALSIAAVASGSIGIGYPVTCTGRNFSYRRSVYESINGFDGLWQFMSGDDDLLLHKANKEGIKISYSFLSSTFVESKTYSEIGEISNQRRRHASKTPHYYSLTGMTGLKIALPLVYLLNLFIVSGLLGIGVSPTILAVSLLLKSTAEFSLLYTFSSFTGDRNVLKYFPLALLIHPFYVVIYGAWGALGKFTWKGQTSNPLKSS